MTDDRPPSASVRPSSRGPEYEASCAYWESLTTEQVHGPVEDLPPMPESMRQPQHRPREAAR